MLRHYKQLSIPADIWEQIKDRENLNAWIIQAIREKLEQQALTGQKEE